MISYLTKLLVIAWLTAVGLMIIDIKQRSKITHGNPPGINTVCFDKRSYVLYPEGTIAQIMVWDEALWQLVPKKCKGGTI